MTDEGNETAGRREAVDGAEQIGTQPFGRTGHASSRLIFGSYALYRATQAEADRVLELLLAHGVNHIDTAPMYGRAEQRIGRWMETHRDRFFLATKSRSRTAEGARKDLQRSLERLRVDQIDLWQMHGLTNPAGWERAMGPGGTLEAFLEARDHGLVRFLGVTGHGVKTPAMHLRSLERFDFDTVMLPFNHAMMQNPHYAADWEALVALCRQQNVTVQTMKAIAWQPCRGRSQKYNTYFYEPLEAQEAIDQTVHWLLGHPGIFIATTGDMQLLPRVLEAAGRFQARPSDDNMVALAAKYDIRPVFK